MRGNILYRLLPGLLVVALISFLVPGVHSLAVAPQQGGKQQKDKGKQRHKNRLAKETSPYLLMHAHNPVNWYPWGPEAFAKAKKEGKLVFLSVGYSSCFWCHVMERESFNNEAVAKLLNKWFVCIKVDREERPDVDHIYMTALTEVMGGRGGWPMSMFLTADGKPFFGGTYWPREDKRIDGETYVGFKTVITEIHKIAQKEPKKTQKRADKIAAITREVLEVPAPKVVLFELNQKLIKSATDNLQSRFDPVYGGFGNPQAGFRGPKFPTPTNLELLLFASQKDKSKEAKKMLDMVTLTLDKMARGGIYDHLGGGFHRYSTERTWTVPHFEKMLYDNAQLAEIYAKAYRVTKKPLYRRVLRETLAYVQREMMSPAGQFYSSQDAETDEEEGRFYVWTDKELEEALPNKKDRQLIGKVYGTAKPNFENKYHILHLTEPLADLAKEMDMSEAKLLERLEPLKRKLFQIRSKREHPFKNKIALTAWSGMMIAGFAEAGDALKEPKYIKVAKKAADFVLAHQKTKEGRLLRTYGAAPGKKPKADVPAYLEDYAALVHGLLALHDVTKEKRWLDEAKKLTDVMIRFHADKKHGGFFFTANDHEKLFARSKDQYDGATPSGNSMAVRDLIRLWIATGNKKYRQQAEKDFRAFALTLKTNPESLTTMMHALGLYVEHKRKASKQKAGE